MSEAIYAGVGKRKSSVARVFLKPGKGEMRVNGRLLNEYFPRERLRTALCAPLEETETISTYDVKVNVCGGGISGQAGAISLGIARALLKMNEELRPLLRKGGFLTRDSRAKERKKYGRAGARRGFQHSKR